MSQETGGDPWDEVEGIPPLVTRIYRTPPGEERSWQTTLLEVKGLVDWLWNDMVNLQLCIDPAFDDNIAKMLGDLEPLAGSRMYDYVREKLNQRVKNGFAVHELLLRLLWELEDELRDALRTSHSGLDK